MRRFLLAASLAWAMAMAASPAPAQERLVIGVLTALTGPLAAPGRFQMNGFNLAVDALNEAGGIQVGSRRLRVELRAYDTRGNPAEGASGMQRLTTVDRVPVVLGEVSSAVVAAIGPIAADNEVPFVLTRPTAT